MSGLFLCQRCSNANPGKTVTVYKYLELCEEKLKYPSTLTALLIRSGLGRSVDQGVLCFAFVLKGVIVVTHSNGDVFLNVEPPNMTGNTHR